MKYAPPHPPNPPLAKRDNWVHRSFGNKLFPNKTLAVWCKSAQCLISKRRTWCLLPSTLKWRYLHFFPSGVKTPLLRGRLNFLLPAKKVAENLGIYEQSLQGQIGSRKGDPSEIMWRWRLFLFLPLTDFHFSSCAPSNGPQWLTWQWWVMG